MKFRLLNLLLLLIFITTFSGCDLVEDVFKAGIWFAIIAILIIGGLIYLLFSVKYKPAKQKKPVQNGSDNPIERFK